MQLEFSKTFSVRSLKAQYYITLQWLCSGEESTAYITDVRMYRYTRVLVINSMEMLRMKTNADRTNRYYIGDDASVVTRVDLGDRLRTRYYTAV